MLKIYNTLARDKQEFVPMRPGLGLAQRGAGRGAGSRHPYAVFCDFLAEAAWGRRPVEDVEDL
jgi:hypothetical protein